MHRRLFCLAALAAGLVGPTPLAQASSPSAFLGAITTPDRYMPQVVFAYDIAVAVSDPATQVSVHRFGSATPVAFTLSGSGSTALTIQITGSLAYGQKYVASVRPDLDATADTFDWTTRGEPKHRTTRVKIVTALEADAVDDIVRRLDRANLTAVPRAADLVDVAADTGRPLTAADLTGYHTALVVTDQDVADQSGVGAVLAAFAAKGRGVVLGGQTHWTTGGPWTAFSALGGAGGKWATEWSPFEYTDPAVIEGGTLKPSSLVSHYLTSGLTMLEVHGAGSGREYVHQSWTSQALAKLQSTADYPSGQTILGAHWETKDHPGRVLDLGFNPWSTGVASGGGGFDPSQPDGAQAAPLIARSVWWAANRIPPTSTRFVTKPPRVHILATVLFTMSATDPDKSSPFATLRYQYRVNKGPWRWARGGTSFALYHLPAGRSYTVRARAVDFAGNIDAKPAVYTFRLTSGASG
ncbi:MAG: hypothetical protein QOJ13_2232 [Gaiellales bacterium]|jgi:hypothetical protein|nr:hypothetical protein [Gaiellales bacterium]